MAERYFPLVSLVSGTGCYKPLIIKLERDLTDHRLPCFLRSLLVLSLLALLPACAPMPQSGGAPVYRPQPPLIPEGSHPPVGEEQRAPREDRKPPVGSPEVIAPSVQAISPAQRAVASLLDEAWGHYRNNELDRAIAVAERAQRLDARSPEVYLLLASSYLAQGKQSLAEQFAHRGMNFSPAGSVVRRQLQQLLDQLVPFRR